ncbi:transcription factor Tfb2 [Metschnikowia bicuspidata var. bicuspidata NRRL YB-4993]|uniref:RNA polymerase II transcription factor B subunit 2 n=1 Tax=Metschnikowia bicuspidata var. bicuspidata NRRL YB-4993 TaxID=869754 RepID=A0A1A0HBZ8_9ASCO|nr:transcription factor Tfb2 [Metschnikowia bicuspidata var. bicuspidata NRRL YB-4993]OBA21536.1 transcription factor Tfb2 [Metschnikowia bicuspidata var. bicuspidata NRRL YB-4993]
MSASLFKLTVNEYLEGLPKAVQSKLYHAPATCLSIYRLLPPLAKFYVVSMMFTDRPVAVRDLEKWCRPHARKLQYEALQRLRALHLLEEDASGTHVRLHQTFRSSFRGCLAGTQAPTAFGVIALAPDKHAVDVAFLDRFAAQKWETILHFMVGSELPAVPSRSVLSLLRLGGLMEGRGAGAAGLAITNRGFQFLLQDANIQIWTLLLEYLGLVQDLHMDPVDVLNFLFVLGSLELGKAYCVSGLSATQLSMLPDLRDCGLVYQRSEGLLRFYPTRLATTLTSESTGLRTPAMALDQAVADAEAKDAPPVAAADAPLGQVVLETNFKLYAYTNSPLEIAVLNLFVALKIRFANMVIGQLTRELVRNALYNGITADQIIRFLETHAHAQMRLLAKEKLDKKIEFDASHNINTAGGAPQLKASDSGVAQHRLEILPPNVVDQIRLWQLELDRIQTFDGYLFKDFKNQNEYDVLCNYASEVGVLLWSDKTKLRFFVTSDGMAQVADFAGRKFR